MNHTLTPQPAGTNSAMICQLEQIASKAARLAYLEPKNRQGRRQIEKDITIMVEQLDEP